MADGRLRPIIEPDDDEGSFYDIAAAFERVDEGASIYEASKALTLTRQRLRNIDENERGIYLGRPDDGESQPQSRNYQINTIYIETVKDYE